VNPEAGPWKWSATLHRSRCGASHKRRGLPCQDYSGSAHLLSGDGLPVGLMAVADGHGNRRYWLSDVGSRLACELALKLAAEELTKQRLSETRGEHRKAIHAWLANDLATRLVSAWKEAIEADWRQRELPEAHRGESFSSQTYGSTLALVVLTPNWWAHTGLGDWDLVQLNGNDPDQIISQEATHGLQGEATESLCLPDARHCFNARTAIYPLGGDRSQGFGLVLSTDGIRKSCATDADYLALSRYLLEEAQLHQAQGPGEATRLDSSLDRISREGSGDDVSVAVACFGSEESMATEEIRSVLVVTDPTDDPPMPPLPSSEMDLTRPRHSPTELRTERPSGQRSQIIRKSTYWVAAIVTLTWISVFLLKSKPPRDTSMPKRYLGSSKTKLSPFQQNQLNLEIKKLCGRNHSQIQSALKPHKENRKAGGNQTRNLNQALADKDWLESLILINRHNNNLRIKLTALCPDLKQALGQKSQNNRR